MTLPQVQNITKDVVSQLKNEKRKIPQMSLYQPESAIGALRLATSNLNIEQCCVPNL